MWVRGRGSPGFAGGLLRGVSEVDGGERVRTGGFDVELGLQSEKERQELVDEDERE